MPVRGFGYVVLSLFQEGECWGRERKLEGEEREGLRNVSGSSRNPALNVQVVDRLTDIPTLRFYLPDPPSDHLQKCQEELLKCCDALAPLVKGEDGFLAGNCAVPCERASSARVLTLDPLSCLHFHCRQCTFVG